MKICPKCQKTYSNDALNFCLDDGTALNPAPDPAKAEDSLPETVMFDQRDTDPVSPGGQQHKGWAPEQQSQPTWGQAQPPPAWGTGTGQQIPGNAPKSKTWLWVVGIIVAVVFLCGGGLIGLIALLANVEPDGKTDNKNITISEKTTPPADEKFDKIDLSKQTDANPADAKSEYIDGELILSTRQRGFYYVILTTALFQSENAITRLTVRNPEEKTTRFGFGLIFHSNPLKPFDQDYGFLIDTEKQRYRLVRHSPGKEIDVIAWKQSDAIKSGTSKNELEIRDKDGEFDLFINGELVESMRNTYGYKGGVPGLYTSDAIPIAFSDFEISR